ncbi:kelch-like protein 10 [Dermacentor andersoni]|uniref:kelch-like protein 10 n=1 Tax=Dermacentor andersoni TaxID=34620 RepID=UPI002155E076|nr:kelch-like protein 10 [Dermacentor andersoni]
MNAMEADDTTTEAGDGKMITVCFEAAQLFNDDGRQPDSTAVAAAKAEPALRDLRNSRQDCDVVFRVAGGVEVWAHRSIMVAKYSGCNALLTVARERMSPEEKQKNKPTPSIRVMMEDLERDMMELLVDFAYDTPLDERIGPHNVAKFLELAQKHRIFWLLDHCLSTLEKDLDPQNCIGTWQLAASWCYLHLAQEALRYLVRNFNEVWKSSPQFQDLRPDEMRTVLADDRLCVVNEVEDTFAAILKWISSDPKKRKAHLAEFLPLVRFGSCPLTDFEKVASHPQVQSDGDSVKVLKVIERTLTQPSMPFGAFAGDEPYMVVGYVARVDLNRRLWLKPRLPKDILFLFGGWTTGATNDMLTYNCRAAKWRVMENQNATARACHGVAVVNKCIYIVGGNDGRVCYRTVDCFDVAQARWSAKASMAYERSYVSVVALQGHIYAMGGSDGRNCTDTVERYDVERNQWSMVASMNDVRSDASAAVAAGRIYIVGGFTGRAILDTVECYDPSTDVWTRLQAISSPRRGLMVVADNETLYIMGGFDGTHTRASMEKFDVRTARFSQLPGMPEAMSNFAAVLLEGCIYTIGGVTQVTTSEIVRRYDIASERWYRASKIPKSCSASAACIIEDVANPAAWV